jgi:hypothetical protein
LPYAIGASAPEVASDTPALTRAPTTPSSNVGATAQLTTGRVPSRLTTVEAVVVPPPEVALQVKVTPAVSSVTEAGAQSAVTAESGSLTLQETDTSDVYQPLEPRVPLTTARTTGGVRSSVAGRQSQAPLRAFELSAPAPTKKLPLKTGCW